MTVLNGSPDGTRKRLFPAAGLEFPSNAWVIGGEQLDTHLGTSGCGCIQWTRASVGSAKRPVLELEWQLPNQCNTVGFHSLVNATGSAAVTSSAHSQIREAYYWLAARSIPLR